MTDEQFIDYCIEWAIHQTTFKGYHSFAKLDYAISLWMQRHNDEEKLNTLFQTAIDSLDEVDDHASHWLKRGAEWGILSTGGNDPPRTIQ